MADSVSVDDVRHVAMLARLGVTDERARELARELNTILQHMTVLQQVNTHGAEEVSGIGAAGMRLARDEGPSAALDRKAETFAPEMRAGFFIVPRLSTHEDASDEMS
jgi:aspartyl-tRNA(Asn)/glutamyl-tRNA(Gln) amidotransferase subunit C